MLVKLSFILLKKTYFKMHNVNLTFTQTVWQSILKAADAAFR